MFYSQFILAKKGPLGTIWIAAHLERKLRKNQVADTDIGVSVDSILFPDVPIALRLSSHLLLGVVRIYSRKVNYLFDDCSDALLKIKQAFRSTAVDLPPEESKAPYHSITLPETFDLDDFELPDNDIFQGNYVDNHISSREQITLQDNMEGVVYSTSQFGLDERFGDGDTSGLDLDEELFMSKIDAAGYSGVSADPQASFHFMTPVKEEEHEEMPATETEIEVAGGDVDLMDYAQAPCTPGLIEEPNLSNVQESSACDDHIEFEDNHLMVSAVKENLENSSNKLKLHQGNEHMVDWSMPNDRNTAAAPCIPCEENGYHSSNLGIKQGQSPPTEVNVEHISSNYHLAVSGQLADKIVAASYSLDKEEELQDGSVKSDGISVDMSQDAHGEIIGVISGGVVKDGSDLVTQCLEGAKIDGQNSNNVEYMANVETPSSPRDASQFGAEFQDASGLGEPERCASEEQKESQTSKLDIEIPHDQDHILRPCNADMGEPDSSHTGAEHPNGLEQSDRAVVQLETSRRVEILQASGASTVEQGEVCNSVFSEQNLKDNHTADPASLEEIQAGSGILDDQGNNVSQTDKNSSADVDVPAPEKMLSIPEEFGDQARNLLMEATPGNMAGVDESDAGSRIVSGRKRSYTESTLTEQSLNSVESSRAIRAKKTVEAVPDDDDLLSSILVGRRSSVLKVKPSPLPPCEITSLKRHRSAPRTSTSKRKVLMDDSMVLHGDTIRQQLINTEDIRRLRKKAPCTRPEIAMIQKQFLEDEIFGESIFSGVSMHLASLHNQPYDLKRITVTQEVNGCSLISETDLKQTSPMNDENAENFGIENGADSTGPKVVETDMNGGDDLATFRENGEIQLVQTCELNSNKLGEDCDPIMDANITEMQMKPTEELAISSPQLEDPQNLAEAEINGGSSSIAGAGNPALPAEVEMDALVQMDEPLVSSDNKRESECVEADTQMMDGVIEKVNDIDDMVKVGDFVASVQTEPSARDGISAAGAIVETERDTHDLGMEYSAHAIEIESMDGRRVENDDQVCDGISREEPIISSWSTADNITSQASSLHEGEHPMRHEAYLADIVDAEISGINMHDHNDLNYEPAADDTEFLNFDDDEVAEVTDDYTPNAEEIRFLENSGWSSRTRAVAKYLQTLFVKEAECGRKALPMDNLLVGKTRKEASRMFFETLVLKTRDYIHVEQESPFNNITLKPRIKLVKSDF